MKFFIYSELRARGLILSIFFCLLIFIVQPAVAVENQASSDFKKGQTALSHSNFEKAYDFFLKAEKKGLKISELYREMSLCASKLGLDDKAYDYACKSIEIAPSSPAALKLYTGFQLNKKAYDKVIDAFIKADYKSNLKTFESHPDITSMAFINVSKAYEQKKVYTSALELADFSRKIAVKSEILSTAEALTSKNAAKLFLDIEHTIGKKDYQLASKKISFLKKFLPWDNKLEQLSEKVRQILRQKEKKAQHDELYKKAQNDFKIKNYKSALKRLDKLLNSFPGDYDALILKSRVEKAFKIKTRHVKKVEKIRIQKKKHETGKLFAPFVEALGRHELITAENILNNLKIRGVSTEIIATCSDALVNMKENHKKLEASVETGGKLAQAVQNYYDENIKTARKQIDNIGDAGGLTYVLNIYSARVFFALEEYAKASDMYKHIMVKHALPCVDLIRYSRALIQQDKYEKAFECLKSTVFDPGQLKKYEIALLRFEILHLYASKGDFSGLYRSARAFVEKGGIDLPFTLEVLRRYGIYILLVVLSVIFIIGFFFGRIFFSGSNQYNEQSSSSRTDTLVPVAKASQSADEILKYQKHLEEEFKTNYMRLSMVINQVKDLTTSLDKDQILKSIIDILIKGMGVKSCSIMMIDDVKRELFTVKSLGLSQEEMNVCIPLDTACFQTYSTISGEMISNISARKDEKLKAMIDKGPLGSVASAPLVDRDKVKGIINIAQLKKRRLSDEDIQLFRTISSIAGLCMNNAELFDQTRDDLISTQKQTQAQISQKKYIRSIFSRYVSAQVVDELLNDPEKLKLGGEKMDITILFSDIRGFTSFSEKHSAEEVVSILNEYLSAMTKIILRYGGTLDKYIGDAIMAIYGAPMKMEFETLKAVITAIHMQKQMKSLQSKWKSEGRSLISMGIGISSGDAVVGNIGSATRSDYTAIGDVVNLASRLQSQAGPDQIMLSEGAYEKVKEFIITKPLPPIKVKGKEIPVNPYLVVDINREKLKNLPFIQELQNSAG